jgi:hypothetical protein
MLRQIIKPSKRQLTVKIPEEYINQEIEILVLPMFEAGSFIEEGNQGDKEKPRRHFKNAAKVKIDEGDEDVDLEGFNDEVNDVVHRYQHVSPLDY